MNWRMKHEKCEPADSTLTMTSKPPVKDDSYFLGLPAELRIEIYEHIASQTDEYSTWMIRMKKDRVVCSEPLIRVCRQLHDEFRDIFDRVQGYATHVTIHSTNFSYSDIAPMTSAIAAGKFSPTAKFKLAVRIDRRFMWPFRDLSLVQAGLLVDDASRSIGQMISPQCIPYDCTVNFVDDGVERDHWKYLVNQVMPGFVVEVGENMLQVDKVAKAFEAALREVKKEGSCNYYSVLTRGPTCPMVGYSVRRAVSPAYDVSQRAKAWVKKTSLLTAKRPERKQAQVDRRWEAWQDQNGSHKIEHITHDASDNGQILFESRPPAPSASHKAQQSFNFHQRTSSVARCEGWRAFHIVGAPVIGIFDAA